MQQKIHYFFFHKKTTFFSPSYVTHQTQGSCWMCVVSIHRCFQGKSNSACFWLFTSNVSSGYCGLCVCMHTGQSCFQGWKGIVVVNALFSFFFSFFCGDEILLVLVFTGWLGSRWAEFLRGVSLSTHTRLTGGCGIKHPAPTHHRR